MISLHRKLFAFIVIVHCSGQSFELMLLKAMKRLNPTALVFIQASSGVRKP